MTRILVVDDEALIRDGLESILGDEGYEVDTAPDGRAALALIMANPPDVVISDVMMPHLDGLELRAQVQVQFPSLPVILMSAVTYNVTWQRNLPAHTAFLAKPFDLEVLLEHVAGFTRPDGA